MRRDPGAAAIAPTPRFERHREPEAAALAESAFDADLAAEPIDETATDRQPEPAAAEPAADCDVGLGERIEDRFQPIGRDADAGVAHLEAQHAPVVRSGDFVDRQLHRAAVGELDGVADQVEQDLPQLAGIADDRRRICGASTCNRSSGLRSTSGSIRLEHVLQHGRRARTPCVLEIEDAGLDFGIVEDVGNDRRQQLAGPRDRFDIFALLGIEAAAAQKLGEPEDAVDRRADFVAHRRQERRLGAVGAFRLLAGAAMFGDVVENHYRAEIFLADVEHALGLDVEPARADVGGQQPLAGRFGPVDDGARRGSRRSAAARRRNSSRPAPPRRRKGSRRRGWRSRPCRSRRSG